MKLLFDENLSARLVPALADLFPGSTHVKSIGLMERPDDEVWRHAKANDFVIVTKDSDFHERSIMERAPPKVVYLRVGNGPTSAIRELLAANHSLIEVFGRSASDSALVLGNVDVI